MCVMRTCVCVYKRVDVCLFFSFFFIYLQMSRHTTAAAAAAAEFPGKSEHIQKERESGRAGARGGYK